MYKNDNKRGSEWRKWDLHLHAHGTVLNNQFEKEISEDAYLEKIESSDISVIGITDYFTCENVVKIIRKFKKKFPNSRKVLFPNIEFRLNENVSNVSAGHVNIHLIFDCELDLSRIESFISTLELTMTNPNGTKKKISDLSCLNDYQSATIEKKEMINKLKVFFGTDEPYLWVFAAGGHGGIRANIDNNNPGSHRNGVLSDEFDKLAHFFFGDQQSQEYFLNGSRYAGAIPKPVCKGSDAHKISDFEAQFSWVKAELTFEGLRQILFEPRDRISLLPTKPDTKSDYQVIDYIEQNGKRIYFNPNLNAIIGGRSTGKSTLLNSIADNLGNENFEENKHHTFKDEITISWQNQTSDDNISERQIDFIPQEYMITLAKERGRRNELIDRIISSKGKRSRLTDFDQKETELLNKINSEVQNYLWLVSELEKLIRPEGDENGIVKQIEVLEIQKGELITKSGMKEKENQEYQEKSRRIESNLNIINDALAENLNLTFLKQETLINEPIKLHGISEISRVNLENTHKLLKEEFMSKWIQKIEELIETNENKITVKETEVAIQNDTDIIKRGNELAKNSDELKSVVKSLEQEKQNLIKYSTYKQEKQKLETFIVESQKEILKEFSNYEKLRKELEKEFEITDDEKKLKITIKFSRINFEDKIKYLRGNTTINMKFIRNFDNDLEDTIKRIFSAKDLIYNQGGSMIQLLSDVFNTKWYKYSFNVEYENANFINMSQGKKSFVILTLLLEFSDDKKPVLIDQPEDSLDNRAIYHELTRYLKTKKIQRQIILVTHNPNIVVGADAENVIVANQHSDTTRNIDSIEFDYVNGALENTFLQKSSKTLLQAQGIREHVIEILEGGKEAIEKREKKYNLKSINI